MTNSNATVGRIYPIDRGYEEWQKGLEERSRKVDEAVNRCEHLWYPLVHDSVAVLAVYCMRCLETKDIKIKK